LERTARKTDEFLHLAGNLNPILGTKKDSKNITSSQGVLLQHSLSYNCGTGSNLFLDLLTVILLARRRAGREN
jgi:hypothetical protein